MLHFVTNRRRGRKRPGKTSATFNGVTFSFDRPMQTGNFVTGEPWVVSSEAFDITSISPASATVDGYVAHGAMKDPYVDTEQGFDEMIANSTTGAMRFGNTAYNASLNIDPGVSGPISISLNEETSIVKTVRLPSVTTPEEWQTIEKYVPLHVLSSAPPADAYPPSSSGTTKTIWTRGDLNTNVLRSITMPPEWTETYSSASATIPRDLGLYGTNGGEARRRFRLDSALGTASSNYSATLARIYARYLTLLHDNSVLAQDREAIIDDVARHAIQIHGLVSRGWMIGDNKTGAGQGFAYWPWLVYGAFLLSDADMMTSAKITNSTGINNGQWVDSSFVGRPAPGKAGVTSQTFFLEHVGMPFMIPDEFGSNHDTRYGAIATHATFVEHTGILLLQNGPNGETGADVILADGPFDNTNQRAASLAVLQRAITHKPHYVNAWSIPLDFEALYQVAWPLSGLTGWSGQPDQLPVSEDLTKATPGDGQLSWDLSSLDYTTETETSKDFRYSLDGVQWVEVADVSDVDSVTGLLRGVEHYYGFRSNSASGAGLWSANYPYNQPIDSGTFRNVATTTGTETASAPAFTTAPSIHARLHPSWGGSSWIPVSGTLPDSKVELICGLGYSSGFPAPTYTFQWKRNGSNISGETNQTYRRVAADAGANITCEITATNASGTDTATTAAVTAPALSTLPATKLIDTDFTWPFIIDYETEFVAITAVSANAVHQPNEAFFGGDEQLAGANAGALQCDKTSSWPQLEMPLKNQAVAGTTYNVSGQFVATGTPSSGAYFQIKNTAGTILFEEVVNTADFSGDPHLQEFSGQIVVAGGETDLDWFAVLGVTSNVGGTSNGDIYLTQLTVEEI